MKDRREYKMSVLGTHHTPKLSFLLVLKQELTLDRTHTRHNATNTKTVVHMLKKIEDQFGLTHIPLFCSTFREGIQIFDFR